MPSGSLRSSPSPANRPSDTHASSTVAATTEDRVVTVNWAEAEFTQLKHELKKIQYQLDQLRLERGHSGRRPSLALGEKEAQADDDFDLLAYLRGEYQTMQSHGFRLKTVGVIFSDLAVRGMGGVKLPIRTYPQAIKDHLFLPITIITSQFKEPPPPKLILSGFNGFVRPGEMCLVLGRPNAGCSTFLKVIANQRGGFVDVSGKVEYGGIEAETMAKHYKGEVVYNPEDDVHHPTLTVGQTLDFALSTKTPAKRLPDETKKIFKAKVLDLLLRMLGISHTKNTYVGNESFRGVSGGERKRVSIAETMTNRACVLSWDNSTRGLDASTALQYARSLRILTNIFKTTMFVTLYQAGEGIYEQFDSVCLINEGRQVYFGPASEARAYMMGLGYKNLPRQTTADYLTGCTDRNERQFADGVDPARVPKTPEEMEHAYLNSQLCQRTRAEMIAYSAKVKGESRVREDFFQEVKDSRYKCTSKRSPCMVPFYSQVWSLMVREFRLKFQDRLALMTSWATTIFISVVVGSVFLDLPKSSEGAFTRSGVMFLASLFSMFIALAELPAQMVGRPIIWRQTSFCFYRGGALAIATTLSDIPFSASKILALCIILYFMAGLVLNGAAFFTFYLVIYLIYLSLSAFFRFLGATASSFDSAARIASIMFMTMVLYSGYLIPRHQMKPWLVWLSYINPISYAFEALMGNEFGRLRMPCEGNSVVPHGPSYPASIGPNQVCILPGSQRGIATVSGDDHIRVAYSYNSRSIWRNVGIECAYFVAFLFFYFLAMDNMSSASGSPSVILFSKENRERRKLNEKLESRKQDFRNGTAQQDLTGLINTRRPLTWEALSYDVKVPGGTNRLLNEIYGYVKPGTLTALMGASGAGKTTLLDVLANRKNTGVIEGDICISGRAPGSNFRRGTGYCEQQDVHEPTATVREAFRFSAYLRQPAHVSIEDKNAYVEEVIQLLELEDFADAMIGFPGFGLGVEGRKRVTIGVELAAKPQLLLFLDEPTSGLDGQSAYNIVRFLKKLAAAGQTILCTIHQPNALLFESFDRLLLLKRGGRCVYFGDIGQDSCILRSYFEKHGAQCPSDANPAEFMLEVIGSGNSRPMGGDKDWADRWLESEEHAENKQEIVRLKQESLEDPLQNSDEKATKYPGFSRQLSIVAKRTNVAFYRNADYQLTRLYDHLFIGLLVGITFLDLSDVVSTMALQNRVFAIFISGFLLAFIIVQVEPMFIMARTVFLRELASKSYTEEVFAISQFLAEVPNTTLSAVAYYCLWYFLTGSNKIPSRAGYAFLMIWLLDIFAVSLGQAIAALSPSVFIAMQVNPTVVTVLTLFCGVVVPHPQITAFWRQWMFNLDPFTRLMSGLVVNGLHGLRVTCRPEEFAQLQPPNGQTCGVWLSDFISRLGGYVQDAGATSDCNYCRYAVGDDYFKPLNYSYADRWRDLGIMASFCVFNFLLTVLAAKVLTSRYSHR